MKNPEKHSEITQAVENTTGERELTQRAAFAYEEDQEAGTDVVYTASQKEVADTVHDMIVSNLDQHITIAEFARSLHVSPTHIKVSFSNVYGLPVYTYARMQGNTAMKTGASLPVHSAVLWGPLRVNTAEGSSGRKKIMQLPVCTIGRMQRRTERPV